MADEHAASLARANDSLAQQNEARGLRIQLLHEAADSTAQLYDSLLAAWPSVTIRYLRNHEAMRTADLDSLWKFMGTLPRDTSAIP